MAIQFQLNGQARLSQQDLYAYTKELAKQPKQLAVQELQTLIDAGEAQLPEGSGAKLRDMQWALQNDAWDTKQQTSGVKRPAPSAVSEIRVERERSMDGTQVAQQLRLVVQGRAEPGTAYEIVNLSRGGTPLASGAVAADGSFNYEGLLQPLFFNEQIGVRIRNQSTGARSETITQLPKSIEVQVKGQARESVELKIAQRQESPFVQQSLIQSTQKIATADAPAGIALAGKAGSVPAGAELQVILGDKVQTARAMLDGSFIFDVKGITPGQQVTLNVIDGGQVTTQQYNTVAVRFDTSGFTASTQGAPYDRLQKGVKDPAGPFLRFGGGNVDPGSIVTVTNYTTGAKFQAVADKDGRIELEISGVHTGDALGFECKDAAGNLSPNAVQNWPVPGAGSENARLKQLLCAQNLLTENVAELSTLIHKMPTSIHRKLVEDFLAGPAAKVVRDAADLQSLKKAFAEAYSGKNDIVTNISNPAPKEPIVVGARVIKPRIMDQGSPAGRDPIEVEGKAEPFSRVEIRNASMPGAPVIGTIQADKNGNFKFISRDESKFLHGDQLYVRSIDQGGAQSTDALAKTCAYELQIWTVQPREVLVELPHATHTRPPFLDMSKTKSESKPIGPKDKEQVHTISGAPGSSEPNAIVRVTNQRGKVFEAATNKDGSFQLNVGEITPGETLTAMVIDTNGITTQQMFQTPALRFDSGKLLSTSNGVPFQRFDGKGAPDSDGPFLRFAAEGAVNPHASVKVTNNSTGESFTVTASETGALDFEARRVHAGDSLSFVVTDPAGNVAPNAIENYVVPGTPQWTADVQALECQHNFASEDVQKALAIMAKAPTAANRAAFESMLKRPEAFLTKGDFEKLKEAFVGAYAAPNNVRNAAENPAPKPPIVLDADIIKPRIMDQGSAANRDPLEVRGKAEPYTTIEIRNASQPGYPVIGSVRTDKNGNFAFTSRDESKFLHGDQIILRATDQGGASSEATLATTCAYELRIWNNPPRSEKVKLEKTQDTRPPFLDQSKVPHSRVAIEKDSKQQIYRFTGNAGASEPFAMIRVTNKRGEAYETQVKKDGSFAVDVGNFEPGETLAMTIVDGNGQTMSTQFGTQALRFDPQAFTNTSEGVPYTRPAQSGTQQKDQAAERTGPFLRFAQDKAVDPFSYVVVKNNSTGQMFRAQADENGRLDLEIAGVHAGDSLSFAVQDPAGNKAPQTLINYVVPATPRPTPRLADIACQQTVLPQHITEAIALLDAAPTAANRALVENWINGEHTSFQQGASKAAIGEAIHVVNR